MKKTWIALLLSGAIGSLSACSSGGADADVAAAAVQQQTGDNGQTQPETTTGSGPT
ncbi:hypothetical protein GE107_20400 [Cohnella sp. CFH 77786]|uniref:hypothetical protein n=1 Tax=Cohnella sp. CFH 77786 TaxID=2662265 RepID=UPI001C6104F5|nr:hypothetical protein [Cohnella sp. CFH 77786]MBW5448409.1 hypothetical protein [Cohnella sp. CFH 77786]